MFYNTLPRDGANQIQNKKSKGIFGILPKYTWLLLVLSFLWNFFAYYGGRLIAQNMYHRILMLPLDDRIPVIPWTAIIYILFFPFWMFNYALAAKRDRTFVMRFFCADFLSRGICLIFYIIIPTTLVQPDIPKDAFLGWMLRMVYYFDRPDNLFPSIHCLVSVMAAGGIIGDENVPKWYRALSCLIAAAICLSTLTTKQHLALDLFSGIALAGIVWLTAKNKAITGFYSIIVDAIYKLIFKDQQ